MYVGVREGGGDIDIVCYYDFPIRFWNCSEEAVFSVLYFVMMSQIIDNYDYEKLFVCHSCLIHFSPSNSKTK